MARTWRLGGTFVILTAWALIAPSVAASGPPAIASPPGEAGPSAMGWLHWFEAWAARLGLVDAPDLPVPGERPGQPVSRAALGLDADDDGSDLTTQGGTVCEPGTTEKSCSIDPNG